MPVGAVAVGGALSAGASIFGASQASSVATSAANKANAQIMKMYKQGTKALQPYEQMGRTAGTSLLGALGLGPRTPGQGPIGGGGQNLMSTFAPTMANLAATPGFQFTLGQGEMSTKNALAAMGLGSSGALGRSIANYSTGLASSTYNQQLQNYLAQNAQAYNMLMGPTAIGATAAGQQFQGGMTAGTAMGSNTMQAGGVQAGAYMQGANALGNMFNTTAGMYAMTQNPMYQYYANANAQNNPGNPASWATQTIPGSSAADINPNFYGANSGNPFMQWPSGGQSGTGFF